MLDYIHAPTPNSNAWIEDILSDIGNRVVLLANTPILLIYDKAEG